MSANDPIAEVPSSLDKFSMRPAMALVLIAFTGSCAERQAPLRVDRIEMRQSGGSSVDVQINRRGEGKFQRSLYPREREGSFSISPRQFAALVERLQPFQKQAVPMSDQSVRKILDFRCPKGLPEVTEAGGFWIRWVGPKFDIHFSADFECDYKRNRVRNDQLRSILEDLSIPALL